MRKAALFGVAALALVSHAALAADPIRPIPSSPWVLHSATDLNAICQPGYTKTVRHTSGKLKAAIYREYKAGSKRRKLRDRSLLIPLGQAVEKALAEIAAEWIDSLMRVLSG